jgi:glycosyltransferase involved in cell wall biosynthesis
VHHGIELDQFTFNPAPHGYLAYLGRVSPEKGLDTAIRVARKLGLPLRVSARMPLSFLNEPSAGVDRLYWERVVRPLLGSDVEFVGEVDAAGKDTLLRNAAALLFPIRWPEPFGLVMAEALACGTPVLALRCGSVPEVVRDGVTGFVCDTENELVVAARRLGELDRKTCRYEAEQRFSPAAMAEAYERVYERMIGSAMRKKVVALPRTEAAHADSSRPRPQPVVEIYRRAARRARTDTGAV